MGIKSAIAKTLGGLSSLFVKSADDIVRASAPVMDDVAVSGAKAGANIGDDALKAASEATAQAAKSGADDIAQVAAKESVPLSTSVSRAWHKTYNAVSMPFTSPLKYTDTKDGIRKIAHHADGTEIREFSKARTIATATLAPTAYLAGNGATGGKLHEFTRDYVATPVYDHLVKPVASGVAGVFSLAADGAGKIYESETGQPAPTVAGVTSAAEAAITGTSSPQGGGNGLLNKAGGFIADNKEGAAIGGLLGAFTGDSMMSKGMNMIGLTLLGALLQMIVSAFTGGNGLNMNGRSGEFNRPSFGLPETAATPALKADLQALDQRDRPTAPAPAAMPG